MDLSDIREEYRFEELNENKVDPSPIMQLEHWLEDANKANCHEYTAMTLATASVEGAPSQRIVLLKYLNKSGLHFFTNYKSRKGKELMLNNKVAANFYWPTLERQVKIEGIISKTSREMSDTYFRNRPLESQISAIISHQSKEVESREVLEQMWQDEKDKLEGNEFERPEHWGGFILKPTRIEFWQGRPYRLHDRIVYQKNIDGWEIKRLAP